MRGKVNLPEKERVCRDVVKCGTLFILDSVLESAKGLRVLSFDRKDVIAVIATNQVIQFKLRFGEGNWMNFC